MSTNNSIAVLGPITNVAKFNNVENHGFMVGQMFLNGKHPLAWLSEPDFSDHPQNYLNSRVEGTCKWFLDSMQFTSWVKDKRQPLWCPGDGSDVPQITFWPHFADPRKIIAGSGKTYIASIVIDHLQQLEETKMDKVIYFYFEQARKKDMLPKHVFGSLLKQLAMKTSEEGYAREVLTMLDKFTKQRIYPSFTTLVEAVKAQAAKFPRVFIILDALDESPGLQGDGVAWRDMKDGILSLFDSDNIYLMLTSRSHANQKMSNLFQNTKPLTLVVSANSDDIRNYAINRYEKIAEDKQWQVNLETGDEPESETSDESENEDLSIGESDVDTVSVDDSETGKTNMSLLDRVVEAVTNTAQNIFLLATLHMDAIQSCNTIEDIEMTLKTLPKNINEAYDRIMDRINARAESDSTLAKNILPWVSCALRPMSTVELQCALTLRPKTWKIVEKRIVSSVTILSVCEGFIIAPDTQKDKHFRFIHPTAQDYILKQLPVQFLDAHMNISQACIGYLSNKQFAKPPCQSDKYLERFLKKNPFLFYAACNWGYHLQQYEQESKNHESLDESEDPVEMALNMLKNDNLRLNLSQITYIPAFKQEGYSKRFPQSVTGLHFASRFGTEKLLRRLIDDLVPDKLKIDDQDTYRKTSLHIAARMGHRGISEILLKHGADIEAATGDGETPLLGAAMNGDYEVVKLLVEKDANVDKKNKPGGTALHWACLNGNPQVVEVLLDHEAGIDTIADPMATVQYGIDSVGFQAMVWLLLDKLALAGLKNLLGGISLHWAALNGNHRVVQLLIERGANVNAKSLMQATPLHAASWNGNEKAVEILLKNGANVSEKSALSNTALREACLGGHKTVARILLEHNADPAAEGDLVGEMTDFSDKDQLAASMATRGVEIEANDKDDGKKVMDAIVRLLGKGDEFSELVMRDMLQQALNKGDDKSGWSALRDATAKGLEALTTLLKSIKKTPAH